MIKPYSFRQHGLIQHFSKLEQRAATIECGPIGNLSDRDIMVEAVPFRQAGRQEFKKRTYVKTADQSDDT